MFQRRLIALGVVALVVVACSARRLTIEVPQGFSGWVYVLFGKADCKTGNVTPLGSVVRVAPNGSACTSVGRYPKTAWVRYYYVDNDHRTRELKSTGWGKGGMIWAQSTELDGSVFRFYVGTEEQFKAPTNHPPIR